MPDERASDTTVLLVDDDPDFVEVVERWLRGAGYRVVTCTDDTRFAQVLGQGADLCLLDLHLGRRSGLRLLEEARALAPEMPVLMLTRDASVSLVVEAMRGGADNYLAKPIDRVTLLTAVEQAFARRRVRPSGAPAARMVGRSPAMARLRERIELVAANDVTVLVYGETGCGKELVAQALHESSARASQRLVALNCAAVHESLQDSELFGHERGAFTGAVSRRVGRFEQADGGTLFLDEVAELAPSLQSKLLRVLQERLFQRVGGSGEIRTDIRIVAATHRDLREEVRAGRFRADLFFRLSVFELRVPPLRERPEDIPDLADHFLRLVAARTRAAPKSISEAALKILAAHDWPGNVRELHSAIEHAAVLAGGGPTMDVAHLPPFLAEALAPSQRRSARETVGQVERELLVQALADAGGNASEAMRRLGMSRSTFYRRLREYGLA